MSEIRYVCRRTDDCRCAECEVQWLNGEVRRPSVSPIRRPLPEKIPGAFEGLADGYSATTGDGKALHIGKAADTGTHRNVTLPICGARPYHLAFAPVTYHEYRICAACRRLYERSPE